MRGMIIVAAAALAVTAWVPTGASAQPDIRIGPGGVRIDTDRDRYERRDRWERRRWEGRDRCRVVIERERRYGRIIETRRRICR